MGKERDEVDNSSNARKNNSSSSSFVINIPSYQEVLESSHRKTAPASFSQAFSFVKNTEFYTPPPPRPSDPSPSTLSSSDRQIGQSEVVSSSSSSSVQCRNAILVSNRQKGNPLLKHIRNVRWNFADIVGDYLLGQSCCALYLSLRYHLLHPDYLYYRIRELQKKFKLQIVLCHIDVEDVVKPLQEVTRTALLHDCTLLCGWSLEECGRYLETIKVYENKPADIIQGQMDTDYISRLNHALTSVRHVNKTDVVTLGSTFGSLSHIMDASMDDLARCPGIGERKVKRLYDTFHEPFKRVVTSRPTVTETTVKDAAEASTVGEITEEKTVSDTSKGKKEEPELTVKSALLAAFAKHSSKVGRKKMKTGGYIEGETETSAAGEARVDDLSSTQKT